MRPRASKRAAPETPVDTGDREATIADAIAAPAMVTKPTPGVALNPTGAEPHVEADVRSRRDVRGTGMADEETAVARYRPAGAAGSGPAPPHPVPRSSFTHTNRVEAQ